MFRILKSLEHNWSPVSRHMLHIEDGEDLNGGGGGGENPPSGGNDPNGEAGRQPEGGEGGQPGARKPGDTGRDGYVPYYRFHEVNEALKQFKALGDPATIKSALDRLNWMQQNPGRRYNEKEVQAIEQELLAVPRIAAAVQNADRFSKYMERQSKNYVNEGNRQTEKFLTDMGREVNDKNRVALTNALSGIISSDPALMERFLGLDTSVFADAFKVFREGIVGNPTKIPGAALQGKKLPAKPAAKPQGSASKPTVNQQPKTERELLDEAGDAAFDLLMQQEG